ncbi:MAG TPA: aldehyde dehydrogenase family protein, partial [Terriglobales bacterium]
MIRRFRHSLASTAAEVSLLVAAVRSTSPREALTSEVIPLFSACKFLERNAVRSLGRRKQAGTAPMWLRGVEVEIEREPFGVVLVIAPGNFPLFLAGVQVLQALVAGNAVLWKPAPGTTEVVERMDSLLITAGFPPGLVQVLSEENEGVETAIDAGVDKVFVTGSLNTGREVQKLVAA